MEQELTVKAVSLALQLLGLAILATMLLAPAGTRGFALESLLVVVIVGLGAVTLLAASSQIECSLSGGMTVAVLSIGAVSRMGMELSARAENAIY